MTHCAAASNIPHVQHRKKQLPKARPQPFHHPSCICRLPSAGHSMLSFCTSFLPHAPLLGVPCMERRVVQLDARNTVYSTATSLCTTSKPIFALTACSLEG